MSPRVLFVCTGNLCRSPFAEHYLRRLVGEERLGGLVVGSAGTAGLRGHPAPEPAVRVARAHGVSLEGHRSRALGPGSVRLHDLLVVMEREHRRLIAETWPSTADKVRLLRDFDGERGAAASPDVFDPMGLSDDEYRRCFDLIARCVRTLARSLGSAG